MSEYFGTLFQLGSVPVLEQSMMFVEARHRLVLSNIANADTPNYRRQDLDDGRFKRDLADAIAKRDHWHPGAFIMRDTARTPVSTRGGVLPGMRILHMDSEGPLRHDANNVSMEREMALMAQNAGRYTTYSNLLRKAFRQMKAAISERPGEG
ncbi:MAG: flagellar basal body rod protein FlgB [Planctomycetota bacterium]